MKRNVLLTALAFVLVCALSIGVCVSLNADRQQMCDELAERNMSDWNALHTMTLHIDNLLKEEPVNMKAIVIKQNTLLSHVANNIEPSFPDHFLTTVYDPFLQDLSTAYYNDGDYAEDLIAYGNANTSLQALCQNVLTLADKNRSDLLDPDSELYSSVTREINSFCETFHTIG